MAFEWVLKRLRDWTRVYMHGNSEPCTKKITPTMIYTNVKIKLEFCTQSRPTKHLKKNLGLQTILYNNTVNVSSLCIARPTAFGLCLWQSENYVSLAWKLAFAGMQTLVSQQKTYFCCATTCNLPSSLITKLYLYYYKLKIAF